MNRRQKIILILLWIIIAALVFLVILMTGCAPLPYNPTLYPSYDVLNPGTDVIKNPLAINADGTVVVNQAFMLWTWELRNEVKKLRDQLRKAVKK